MNVDITQIRDFIQSYGLYMQTLAFIAYILHTRKTTAFFYSLLFVILFTTVHFVLEKQLLTMGHNPIHEQLVYNIWYLGAAYTDALLIILVIYICKKKALAIDTVSRMILLSYFCLGAMQIARYLDRIIIESDILGSLYSIIVPTINVGITLLVCVYVLFLIGVRFVNSNIDGNT